VDSHEKFQSHHGFPFPLLADTSKSVVRQWGLRGLLGMTKRAVFVVDEEGRIEYANVSLTGLTYANAQDIAAVLGAHQ
jgi:peroxiredoxin Q/BCP